MSTKVIVIHILIYEVQRHKIHRKGLSILNNYDEDKDNEQNGPYIETQKSSNDTHHKPFMHIALIQMIVRLGMEKICKERSRALLRRM